MTIRGVGPFPTRINFGDSITDHCFLLETAAVGQVFGTKFEDLYIGMGTNASHAIYSQGAHQFSGLHRVSIGNVNQTGVEFASTGGPTRIILDDVHITAGTAVSLSSRLGIVLNNGSENDLRSVDVEGGSGFVFAKGMRLDFGHLNGNNLHFEYCTTGLSCEQTAAGGHVVSIDGITGTTTVSTLISIAATFIGTVSAKNIVCGSGTDRVANGVNSLTYAYDLAHYEYTTPDGSPSVIHYLFPNTSSTNWVNKGYQGSFNVAAANRIYSLLSGLDGSTEAVAVGVSFDGTGYETVIGNADSVGGAITEKIRAGRTKNTSAVPLVLPNLTVTNLPVASTMQGARANVTDSNATLAAGLGNIVAGGGANFCPVYSDGTNWRIG